MIVFVASIFCTKLSGGLYKNVWTVVYCFNFAFIISAEYCHSCKLNLYSDPPRYKFVSHIDFIFLSQDYVVTQQHFENR